MERKEFQKTIQKYRRRINLAELLKLLVLALAIGAAVGILFQAVALVLPFYYANLYTAAAMLLAMLTAFVAAYVKRSNMKQAALMMDSFGFQERIVTAYEHLDEEGEMVRLQREDAMGQLKDHKERIRIPLLPPWKKLAWTVGLFLVMCVMVLIPSEMKEHARELHEIRQGAKEKEEEIEEVVAGLEKLAQEELTPEQLEALQEMLESMQSSMTEYQQATSQEMLSAAQEKLDYKYENMSSQLSELAAILQNGATASAATAESMQAMANQLQQLSGSQQLASNQGQNGQSGQNGNQSGQSGNGQGGQNGNQSGQSGNGQGGQNGNQNGQSGNGQGGQNGSQSGQSGNGQGGQNGNQSGQSGNGQGGQNGSQNGQSGNGQGGQSGNGQGNGQGSGSGSGNGTGSGAGRGEGSSSALHDYVSIPNAILDSGNLTGNAQNHDNSEYFRTQNGLSWEGERVSYEAVIGEYEKNAYEGIAAGQYPSGMEDVIKEYFASFN